MASDEASFEHLIQGSVLRTVDVDSGRNRIPPERETDSSMCYSYRGLDRDY